MWKSRLFRFALGATRKLNPFLGVLGLEDNRQLRRLKDAGRRKMWAWMASSGELILIGVDGFRMYVFNRPHFLSIYLAGSYESHTARLFKGAVRPGATVLDIGANVGYFSLIAARQAGMRGKVYAFEPGPDNFDILRRNIQMNELTNIEAVPKAVSDESGSATLSLAETPDQHSLFSPPMVATTARVTVQCITVDDFMKEHTVDVIKMDIEGNELRALDGMRKMIMRSQALTMFVELNPSCLRQARAEPEELIGKLESLGFRLQVIDEESRSLRTVTSEFAREIDARPPGWFVNLYCVKGPVCSSAASSGAD